MRAVNLLPEQKRRGGKPSRLTPTTSVIAVGAGLLAVVVAAFAFLFMQSHGQVSGKQDNLTALQQQVTQLQDAQARKAALQSGDQARVSAFTTAAGARMRWDGLLDDISRVLPAGSWLTSMNMQAGNGTSTTTGSTSSSPSTPTGATAPTAFTVSGVAFTQDTVASVMQRLSLVPSLSDVTLQSSSRTTVGTAKAYQFTMSANVLTPEVAQ
jgi:Tfp pilus assembly protein PilN